MEMQPRRSPSQNVYNITGEQAETENVYQCLQTSPTVSPKDASGKGKKILVLLVIMNILLLTTVVLVSGIHYQHFRQHVAGVLNDQKTNPESWYLHDETFYLFWINRGDCRTAERFCANRMANLATDWLQSQTNGKRMLVKTSQSHSFSSGSFLSSDDDDDDDDDESDCELFGVTSDPSEQVEGWVCERATTG